MSNTEITHPLERYERIADPTIRQQCIENFDEKWYKENQNDDNGLICDAIFIMCIWGDTKQGLGYWLDIHESAKNGTLELLPEPIEEPTKYISREIADQYQGLFNLISKEHGLTLTISEMDDIVSESLKLASQSEIDQLRSENEKLRECLYNILESMLIAGTEKEEEVKQLLNK